MLCRDGQFKSARARPRSSRIEGQGRLLKIADKKAAIGLTYQLKFVLTLKCMLA
jgi:hypothetical protein